MTPSCSTPSLRLDVPFAPVLKPRNLSVNPSSSSRLIVPSAPYLRSMNGNVNPPSSSSSSSLEPRYPFKDRTTLVLAPLDQPDFVAISDTTTCWTLAPMSKSLKDYSISKDPIANDPIEQLIIYREISGNLKIMLKMKLDKEPITCYKKMQDYLIKMSFIEKKVSEDILSKERIFYLEQDQDARKLLTTIQARNNFSLEAQDAVRKALVPKPFQKVITQAERTETIIEGLEDFTL